MKRILILLAALLLSSSFLFASPAFGYSIAPVGERDGDSSYGGLALSFSFSPSREKHIADMDAEVHLSLSDPYFNGVLLRLSSPLFLTTDHVFGNMFPNKVCWGIRLSAGIQYRLRDRFNLILGVSPLWFADTDFTYEFFSPYAVYSFADSKWGFGMYILRFSYFFGGLA